jgi:hypothetical protein
MRRCIGGDGCRAKGAGQGGGRTKKEERKKKKEERRTEKRKTFLFGLLTPDH